MNVNIQFIAFERHAKDLVITCISYFFFFSRANLDGLAKVVSVFFSVVALGVCDQYQTY